MVTGFSRPSRLLCLAAAIAMASMLQACAGSDGSAGARGAAGDPGTPGQDGQDGQNGQDGKDGKDGANGGNVQVTNFHGVAVVTAEDEEQGTEQVPPNPKYLANIAITGATADAAGTATVTFTVKAKDNVTPVLGLTAVNAGIFKLAPKETAGRSFNRWVPYIFRSGRAVNAGYREGTSSSPVHGTLVENGGGSYTYTFGTNLSTAKWLWDATGTTSPGPLVGYDRTLTHRVSVYLGGHAGPTGEADFDFVPDGVSPLKTRDIVKTATCKKCHGAEFRGHGGDRVTVEGCNTCHSPDGFMVNGRTTDPVFADTSVESLAMQVMLHKMHAGRELRSAPGPDGVYFDDPSTPADETLDNGTYRMGSLTATWRSGAFPAGLANCVACHTGGGADVNNWKTVPSREACGSCHDDVNFTTGVNHIAQADDAGCTTCHPASGSGIGGSVETAHAFMTKDIRNEPEFLISITTSAPGNGSYFVAGEAPIVTVVLRDAATGNVIDHAGVVEDGSGEGCTVTETDTTTCTNAADGLFRSANMWVSGPRAKRLPVLTTPARAKVGSNGAGPWSLTAGAQLRVVVDSGNFIVLFNHEGEDVLVPGDFTVALPATAAGMDGLFATSTAATAGEIVAWLNGSAATFTYNERNFTFSDRAIAYVENGGVAIRTRGLGSDNVSVQIPDATKALGVFTDTAVKTASSSGAQLRQRTNAANNDPKFSWSAAALTYQLDAVDDLPAGTYMINVEFADRGRGASSASYRTPSVAVATFQVKQAGEEWPIARNCTSCHWSTDAAGQGVGYVLDFPRHNKPFDAQALDQCGGCHDYSSGETVAARTWSVGAGNKPISKRVHSIHNGAALTYPVITVDHEDSVPGRGWKITYPMEVRNCESCHPAPNLDANKKPIRGTGTSGTWMTNANRLACMGCHDTDAATAHMKLNVYDPTPTAPWSGDEQEACTACH